MVTLTRLKALLVALGLVVSGVALKTGYDVVRHSGNDHVQHHLMLIVMNELLQRDPSLRTVLETVIGPPEAVLPTSEPDPDPPADPPDPTE